MAAASLRPGGCLVIGDTAGAEPGEEWAEGGAMSSLLFYAWSHGRNFTRIEIAAGWSDAGFGDVGGAPHAAGARGRCLVVATRDAL